jgi:hypothetical protein
MMMLMLLLMVMQLLKKSWIKCRMVALMNVLSAHSTLSRLPSGCIYVLSPFISIHPAVLTGVGGSVARGPCLLLKVSC